MTPEHIIHQIASEEKFITQQQQKQDAMRSLHSGVRSSSISTDLAMIDISISNANKRIEELRQKLEDMHDAQ
jgi:hypothetical protein